MIERVIRSPFIVIIIMAVVIVNLYTFVKYPEWNVATLILLVLSGCFYTLAVVIHNLKVPERKIKYLFFTPYELKEDDEGQQWVTNRACRKVYIFYYFAVPFGAMIVAFFPIFPEVPLLVFFIMATVQFLIYWFETKRYLN